ncbi:hypothetical protein QBC47DRAFT_396935 [Echria macrotheca]|uniref:RING-type domain-containing protein n=1 Tax=Echria macrotheca TaxID=438768 RepID=A0AAJ0BME6_9PEZI|nr:hypothetical protein QBC47DRAFT_396935 [Echria macrotheca]
MSTIMGTKKRRSKAFSSDKKDRSAFEKRSSTTKVSVEATCPICQELVGVRNPEGITEAWSMLPCGHRFGSHCIKHYLRLVATDSPSCPVCRQTVHHRCGHPYLPVLLPPGSAPETHEPNQKNARVLHMQMSSCQFCTERKTVQPPPPPRARRGKAWRAGSLLLSVVASPVKLVLGRRATRAPERPRAPLLIPWETDEGPWMDAYPRPRDVQWERWWDSQEPKQKSPAVGLR